MKLRLFGPGGRVWRLAFRIKHTAKSLKPTTPVPKNGSTQFAF